MILEKTELNISKDFSGTPGPRKREEGEFSGEEFLETVLRPRFEAALIGGGILHVNLDGAAGYPTSFLEASFGGLARQFGPQKVLAHLELTCTDEPYLEEEIRKYILEAKS
jgi:hypothetical protein